jgi:gelsolin
MFLEEGESGAGVFLAEFGEGAALQNPDASNPPSVTATLLRISDATGSVTFESVEPPDRSSLDSLDAFLLDHSCSVERPAVYVWLGKAASLNERRLAVQYAQTYLYGKQGRGTVHVAIPVIRMNEGHESEDFLEAISM